MKKRKEKLKIDYKYLIIGLLCALVSFLINLSGVYRVVLILLSIIFIVIALFKGKKKKNKLRKMVILAILMLFLFIFLDTVVVITFKRIPIFAYNIISSGNTVVYNGLGYRVWQCDKDSYKNLKVDPFYEKGFSCDAVDIEQMDANSFLNSVVENYDEYKNNYVKIKGKISKKNAQNYIEMQPYENSNITVNGYVTFADNITLRIIFNDNEKGIDKFDVYDDIVVVGIVKNMEQIDDKYVVYMYDSKVFTDANYEEYKISVTKESECSEQSILYSSDETNIYTYCLDSMIVSYEDKKYELSSALSSNKITMEDLYKKALKKEVDDDKNTLYYYDNYNILKCNDKVSKDVIIGSSDMNFKNVTCANDITK